MEAHVCKHEYVDQWACLINMHTKLSTCDRDISTHVWDYNATENSINKSESQAVACVMQQPSGSSA